MAKKLKTKLIQLIVLMILIGSLYLAYETGLIELPESLEEIKIPELKIPSLSEKPALDTNTAIKAVYFCPENDCEQKLLSFLAQAQEKIDCAVYDIDLESVKEAFRQARNQGVKVRVISDLRQSAREKSVLPWLIEQGLAKLDLKEDDYMHNKFCIIDSNTVWVGSMNFTDNGVNKNNNNAVLIESKFLAENFEKEFEEMWQGNFGAKSPAETVNVPDSNFEVYFCPEDKCAEQIIRFAEKTEESLDCMFFSFTHDAVGESFIAAKNQGVNVRVVFESRQVSQYSEFSKFEAAGLPVLKDQNPFTMHHKFCVFDKAIALTGSMNPSQHADTANDESILFIKDKKIAKVYSDYFEGYWQEWS